jgi:hypothetical protein
VRHDRPVHGQVAFRYYDDSRERRRGTYELKSAMDLWTRCAMTAITVEGSALHCAVEAFRAAPRETVRVSVLTFARCLDTCANTSDGQLFAHANTSIQLLLEQSCPDMSGLSRHVRIV